jgi:hypothetical protein
VKRLTAVKKVHSNRSATEKLNTVILRAYFKKVFDKKDISGKVFL